MLLYVKRLGVLSLLLDEGGLDGRKVWCKVQDFNTHESTFQINGIEK